MHQVLSFLRNFLGGMPRVWKRVILICFDAAALSVSVWAAYCLRLGIWVLPNPDQLALVLAAPLVAIPVFVRTGLYRSVIRYLPERAFWTMANSVIIATLLWIVVLFAFEISRQGTMPRSVPAIYCLLAILVVVGSRFAAKYLLWEPGRKSFGDAVLIYGAGSAGAQLAQALMREGNKYVAALIDDDPSLQGRDVAGVRVYGPHQIPNLITTEGIKEAIVSIPSIDSTHRQEIVAKLSTHHIKIRTLPAIADLASGRYLISQIREINIDDILGRSTVPADPELLQNMIEGRSVLISGAGGSIGSELCRLVAKWNPRQIVLLEANEFALYQIERDLRKRTSLPIAAVLGSVGDEALIRRTLKTYGVQVVFHAAAHKHVPLVEANVLEGIRNNVFGTQTIAKAAYESGVEHFVLISTDKAVRPPNVMGATKRWAELITHSFAERAAKEGTGQKFCAVRFGNVLGSNGSVVPLFKEQIANGGPVTVTVTVTVTDEEMTRYFMSIHEAAELIVQAGALSEGGDTFLLEMGQPVRIRDLAENMIRLAGLSVKSDENPRGDIAIQIIGRRPAEKTHEELFYDPYSAKPTKHLKILRAPQNINRDQYLREYMTPLAETLVAADELAARRVLFDVVNGKVTDTKIVKLASANERKA